MGSHAAFFYGTLMAPEVLNRVIFGRNTPKSRPPAVDALLFNYTRHRVRLADYPAIVPDSSPGACVKGCYVTNLTDDNIFRLGVFEGYQYDPVEVEVQVGEGDKAEVKKCFAYVWCDSEALLEKTEWDYDDFRRERMHRWAGTDVQRDDYDDVDEAVARGAAGGTDADPTGGRGVGGGFSQRFEVD